MLAAAHLRASELKLSPRRENKASIGLKDFIGSARQRAVRLIRSRFLPLILLEFQEGPFWRFATDNRFCVGLLPFRHSFPMAGGLIFWP